MIEDLINAVIDALAAPFRMALQQSDVALWNPERTAEPSRPRLRIRCIAPGWWTWELAAGTSVLDGGQADSWGEALAVGGAALELAALTPTTQES